MRTLAVALIGLALSATASAGVEILGVESATGGIWRPGRFSVVTVRVRATPGAHEIRGRLESDKIAVTRLDSAGGEETVSLAMLPERDASSIEIDAGSGFTSHEFRLRAPEKDRLVVGVLEPLTRDPTIGDLRREHGWHELVLPRGGGPAPLRDVCHLVIEEIPGRVELERRLEARTGGALTGGPVVARWLADRMAGAGAPPRRARRALAPLTLASILVLGLVVYGRRRGWRPGVVVLAATGLGAVLLVVWLAAVVPESRPRVAGHGFSLVRSDGARTDLVVFAARGIETTDLRAPAGMLMRPIAGPTGRIGPYVLEDARVLRDVALGRGRLAFARWSRAWTPVVRARPRLVALSLEDAFMVLRLRDRAWWMGHLEHDGPPVRTTGIEDQAIGAIWDRFREDSPTGAMNDRGRLLRKIARPASRSGVYGYLATPPELDAEALGIESAEIRWAMLVP